MLYNTFMEEIKLNNETRIIFDNLINNGYKCFIVGGCVRDYLMNKTPNDIDFATNATPNQIKECFKDYNVIETGIKHGTLTILINHIPFEITTYRKDGKYLDNRHPESVDFVTNLKDDLERRDFTINAIAYNPKIGFIDYFNGIEDIKNKIIRCVNNPEDRFSEDALRILRALRFSSTLDFEIEEKTKQACHKLSYKIKKISFERIRDELFKIIIQPKAYKIIMEYVDVLAIPIPELLKMQNFEQKNPYHIYTVLEHTCVALKNAKKDLIVCLSILLHDIGKSDTFSIDKNGIGHFYNHQIKSVEIARNILNRLKVDNNTKDKVLKLIKYHDIQINQTKKSVKKLCYKIGDLNLVKKLIEVKKADIYGQSNKFYNRIKDLEKISQILDILESENLKFSLKDLAVNGYDILKLNIEPTKIGKILDFLLKAVLEEKVINDKTELVKYLETNIIIFKE